MATTDRPTAPEHSRPTSTAVEQFKRTGLVPVGHQAEIAAYLARRRVER